MAKAKKKAQSPQSPRAPRRGGLLAATMAKGDPIANITAAIKALESSLEPSEERTAEDKILAAVMKDIQKTYGAGAVSRLIDEEHEEVDWIIPTGVTDLDHKVFGVGGLPLGKLTVLIGVPDAGKSTLCKVIEAAAARGAVHYRQRFDANPERRRVIPYRQDVERSGMLARDMSLGIDVAHVLGSPDHHLETLEKCFDLQDKTLTSIRKHGGLGLGILDSVTAPMMSAEQKLDYDDETRRGLRAAFLSLKLKKLMDSVLAGGTNGLLFTNQVRENMRQTGPWSPRTTDAGGFALRYYAGIKIEMIIKEKIRVSDRVVGVNVTAKCVRNKFAAPFGEADLRIFFNPPRVESATEAPVRQAAKL